MDKVDRILGEILERCRAMTPEELERNIKAALATPLGRMLKQMNEETLEALALIEQEEAEQRSNKGSLQSSELLPAEGHNTFEQAAVSDYSISPIFAISEPQDWILDAFDLYGEYAWAA